jgi:hypothetical protein
MHQRPGSCRVKATTHSGGQGVGGVLRSSYTPSPPSYLRHPPQPPLHDSNTSAPARLQRGLPSSLPPPHSPGSVAASPWRSRPRLRHLLKEVAAAASVRRRLASISVPHHLYHTCRLHHPSPPRKWQIRRCAWR